MGSDTNTSFVVLILHTMSLDRRHIKLKTIWEKNFLPPRTTVLEWDEFKAAPEIRQNPRLCAFRDDKRHLVATEAVIALRRRINGGAASSTPRWVASSVLPPRAHAAAPSAHHAATCDGIHGRERERAREREREKERVTVIIQQSRITCWHASDDTYSDIRTAQSFAGM
jgi:hypothetical protein